MRPPNVRDLERHALDAHCRGDTWGTFWTEHGAAVCRAEPNDRDHFARLVRRLLALVTSGDTDGMEPWATTQCRGSWTTTNLRPPTAGEPDCGG
jgi:hypothetical protein